MLVALRLETSSLLEQLVPPQRREHRVAAEVLRVEDVVGGDLPPRVTTELLRLLEHSRRLVRVAGPEQADAAVELDERALRVLLAEALERREAAVRPVREGAQDLRSDGAGQRFGHRRLAGLRMQLRRVVARPERDPDDPAGRGDGDGGYRQGELDALGQGLPDASGNTVWRYYRF